MPLDPDFVNDCPYLPEGQLIVEILYEGDQTAWWERIEG
jgi:hypothetical protein